MRLRLIYPHFRKFLADKPVLRDLLRDHVVGDYTMPPSLALPIIAACTPADVTVNLTDDNIGQPIDYNEPVDAVIISCFTPQAARAYAIADEFRRHGRTVIMGGIHPTAMPQEALLHADAVCVGEVEPVWLAILADLKSGRLKPLYQSSGVYNLADLPIPRRDIFPQNLYKWNAHLVITMRGCPVRCGGCPIPHKEGTLLRFRPIDNIVADIRSMPYRQFYLTDDTVMLPGKRSHKFMLALMERTAELDVSIFVASTMMMVNDPLFFTTLRKGGVSSMYTVMGFDRESAALFDGTASAAQYQAAIDLVRMNEDAGIRFFASFGVGFDSQDGRVFDRILKFAADARIDLAEFYILTPFPGTPFGEQIEREGRLLHRDYSRWNHGNVVFKPRNFSVEELEKGFEYLWREFYRNKKALRTVASFEIQ